ncbi:MAG: Hsp20/alpha crystallin family protein [Chitinispirillales bacterium]|nr:Hsp20/alpha crystallin family protein [Chitinispirillales bacterium]
MSALVMRPVPSVADFFSIFDRVFGDRSLTDDRADYRVQPRMDVSEEENKYAVTLDIPGLAKEDISIKVENGTMKIEGERKEERTGKYHLTERTYGRIYRSFALPDDVDAEKIEAKANNGVLEISLPKNQKALPVEIKIK